MAAQRKTKPPAADSALLLYGKNILISGVNSKSAQAVALGLAAEGANLILVDKEPVILDDLAKNIYDSYGLQSLSAPLDLSYDRARPYEKLVRVISDKGYRHLDGAIILSSYTENYRLTDSNIMNYPTPMWKDVMQINLDGVFIMVKTLLPYLLNARQPCLVFSIIEESELQRTKDIAYGAAQYGLSAFMKLLAAELDTSHLSVSGVNLGADFYSTMPAAQVKKIAAAMPQLLAAGGRQYHNRVIDLREI